MTAERGVLSVAPPAAVVWALVLVLLFLLADDRVSGVRPARGQDEAAPDSLSWLDAQQPALDPEDAARLREEMEGAGAVLLQDELPDAGSVGGDTDGGRADGRRRRRAGTDPPGWPAQSRGDGRGSTGPGKSRTAGRVQIKADVVHGRPTVATMRLESRLGPARLLLRRRSTPGGSPPPRGGLSLGAAGWDVGAGGIGFEHGLGLLCSAPGRGRGLSASGSLAPGRQGWLLDAAEDDPRAVAGWAAAARVGPCLFETVAGRLSGAAAAAAAGPGVSLARLAVGGDRVAAAGLGMRWAGGGGASLHAACGGEGAWLQGECAAWRTARGENLMAAWGAVAALRARNVRVEIQAAAAGAGRCSPLARLPAVLPGWDGRGWAVRAVWRAHARLEAAALVGRGTAREQTAAGPGAELRERSELSCVGRPAAGWRVELRLRRGGAARHGWEGRSPWLPAALLATDSRSQVAGLAERTVGPWRLRLTGRTLTLMPPPESSLVTGTGSAAAAAPQGAARRQLVMAEAERRLGRGWTILGQWGWAWGEAVDLQGVSRPAPGLAVPRHWGGWSGERGLGCARAGCAWSAALGLSLRRPSGAGSRQTLEVRQQISVRW